MSGFPSTALKFDSSLTELRNSGKLTELRKARYLGLQSYYSNRIQIRTNQRKWRIEEILSGFQIQSFQVTQLTSKCGSMHGVLPTREAHQASRVFIEALLHRHDWLNCCYMVELSLQPSPPGQVDTNGPKPQTYNHMVGISDVASSHPELPA